MVCFSGTLRECQTNSIVTKKGDSSDGLSSGKSFCDYFKSMNIATMIICIFKQVVPLIVRAAIGDISVTTTSTATALGRKFHN